MSAVEVTDKGAVRVITFNRPDRRNATSAEMVAAINDALPMPAEESIRAVVLTGSDPAFSAGGDLKAKPVPIEPGSRRMREVFNPMVMRLATLPLPVIAAVNGPALGAGLSLALAADLRVASRRAVFSSGFVDVGLATDTGSSYFLPRLVGRGRAFEILTTGRKVGADEALAMGLVNRVVEHEELLPKALELAELLCSKPGIAVPALKELLEAAGGNSLAQQLEAEAMMYDRAATHPQRLAAKKAKVAQMSGGRTTDRP
ncbi:enoyl-CoA hydratase/isomerase family protein [Streptomyces sp. NPDC097610]|uniref:enoyl-CoA hydratase/isomerase family protein n=1 Tax=Streptomyces sp. NPDC097610 TaxID=3157227 RepID=UPI00331FABE3